jgi:hypothetical protein
MVQDMVTNPATNFGFMLRLETEILYRSLLFASSDHSNSALWPELTVSYKYFPTDTIAVPCPCEANFSYLVNTLNPNSYYFTASNSALSHQWSVNNLPVSNANSFVYNFDQGTHQVCYRRMLEYNNCDKCITLCIENPPQDTLAYENDDPVVPQGTIPPGDVVSFDNKKIEVYPNPTKNEWTVKIVTEQRETVKIRLADTSGRIVYSDDKALIVGNNSFVIKVNNLTQGSYFLQITGNTIKFSNVLLKE